MTTHEPDGIISGDWARGYDVSRIRKETAYQQTEISGTFVVHETRHMRGRSGTFVVHET